MNPAPKPGQVWQSTDPRDGDRSLIVEWVGPFHVEARNVKTCRLSRISVWRMTHSLGRRGYRLLV